MHVRTADACDVFVPNAQIFREPLHNYTRDGLRRPSFTVGVAYQDAPEAVIDLLEKAVTDVEEVLSEPQPFFSIVGFTAQFIEYEVFFWLDAFRSRRGFVGLGNDVRVACWRALRDAGMTFSSDVTTIDIAGVPPLELTLYRTD